MSDSLHSADTVLETRSGATGGLVTLVAPALPEGAVRYVDERELGRGGMGVVSSIRDQRIGRSVARKRMRPELGASPDIVARFVREAQVQGQLEHPAVVPVYDVDTAADGSLYFTMKSVRGVTLLEVIDGLHRGRPEFASHTQHRLLTAFQSVCLALDYAHRRGVLHRDLKPANIMLGDFGEVYVLDWGIAKVQGAPDPVELLAAATPDAATDTEVGAILGTPGYMAPELLRGQEASLHSEVYALGAILFELLTYEPLHPRGSSAIAATLGDDGSRLRAVAADHELAPELEQICRRATAPEAGARYGSARELHDAVERFLEGERDVKLRREKAAAHAAAAETAAAELRGGHDEIAARRRAMQEIGRALAFDPENRQAMDVLTRVLAEPPRTVPPEVEQVLEREFHVSSRWIARAGGWIYTVILLFLPVLVMAGVRDYAVVIAPFGCSVVAAMLSWHVTRRYNERAVLAAMVITTFGLAITSRLFSPLLLTPAAVAINSTAYALFVEPRHRNLVVAVGALGLVVPLVLELTGTIAPTFVFDPGGLRVLPTAIDLQPTLSLLVLSVAGVASLVLGCYGVGYIRDRLGQAERRVFLYAWHLREFVPHGARVDTDPSALPPR